jgi:hypothetical protein
MGRRNKPLTSSPGDAGHHKVFPRRDDVPLGEYVLDGKKVHVVAVGHTLAEYPDPRQYPEAAKLPRGTEITIVRYKPT